MLVIFRLSQKIRQLNEGGLIKYWIENEMDKVARMSADGKDKNTKYCSTKNMDPSASTTRAVRGLSLSNLQV